MTDGPARPPSLQDWLSLLRRRYRPILVLGLASGLLALGAGFLLPKWYRASASILPPQDMPGLISALDISSSVISAGRGRYAGGFDLFDIYLGILRSDAAAREVIGRFELSEHYGTSSQVSTLDRFRDNLAVEFSYDGIITVSVEDRDAGLAAEMTNAMVEELDRLFRERQVTAAQRQREFWESRAASSAAHIDSLENVLTAAQVEGGVTAMGRNASEASRAAADLLSRRMELMIQLDMLRSWELEGAPLRQSLEAELTALESEIARLPGVGLRLAEALRDLKLAETLNQAIVSQLEKARLEEARDSPVVQVLDRAVPPDRHVRPRRGLMAVAGTLLGTGLTLAWFAYREGIG